ncbi:MAG: DUF4468 domain-containing protein [Bacteroidetes bacterium]|nr:DUF4468 domain-containing protein [Bacteroidota bacterium]
MRNLIRIIGLCAVILCCKPIIAQDTIRDRIPVDSNTRLITYKNALNVSGKKEELYNRGIEWVNANFKNPAEVTRRRDAVNGEIEGIHRIQLSFKDKDGINIKTAIVEYTFKLQFKDNKYRYTFTDFYVKDKSKYAVENWLDKSKQGYSPLWDEYLLIIDNQITKQIETLKKIMLGKKEVKDDW